MVHRWKTSGRVRVFWGMGRVEMSLYQKLTKVMNDRNVDGYAKLLHEDAEIIFHKSGNQFTKTEWVSMAPV